MPFQLTRVDFADRPAAGRLARFVNRLTTARHEMMPVLERFARGAQPVGAGRGQPSERVEAAALKLDAIIDQFLAARIIAALAGATVEQFARHVGGVELARLIIFEFVQAAAPAAVAQCFPFAPVEAGQGSFPKRFSSVHRRCSHGRA